MDDIEEILRLIPIRQKGFLRLIFSRFAFILVLIFFQFTVFILAYERFREYFQWFAGFNVVFYAAMLFYLFNCSMDSSAKLTWLNLIMLFPLPASILLWFTQNDIGHRAIKFRIMSLIHETKNRLVQDENTIHHPLLADSGTDDLCRYINRSGCFPIYECTQVTYYPIGEKAFAGMIEELQKAEKFIFMEFFIIDEGYMWGTVLSILAEKARQGVEVRVMYDGMCEVSLLPHDYPKRMKKLGIQCKAFSPITPFISTYYNYRDHRKILVIDGKVAFNGGINLADEYINRRERFGHWKDTAVMLKGEAVSSFTLMFLQMWNISERNPEWDCYLNISSENITSDGFVMPYADCPLDGEKVGESVYMDMLYRATDYVHIMTPYLILDGELETALKYAAQRGVDVRIILPGIPDKKSAYALAKTHYKSLIHAGVKIYEYTRGFVHAKVFVSDDIKGVVGTINLDYRSLYHHFECATYLYRSSCIGKIEDDFQKTMSKCRKVTPDTIRQEKWVYKMMGGLLKILAPMM